MVDQKTAFRDAEMLHVGDIIVHRNSRGRIESRYRIDKILPCTDGANTHLHSVGVSQHGSKIECYVKLDKVEILSW